MQNTLNAQLSRRNFTKYALAAGAACIIGCGLDKQDAKAASESTLNALSSAQSQYESAMSELQSITEELETAQYNLSKCQADLQSTNDQIAELESSIAQKQSELLDAQNVLAERVNASYRAGTSNLLDVLLNSTDFEDFVSRLYYANKVSDSDAEAIDNVKSIKAELETEETQLQEQRTSQEQLLSDQQDYTDQLSSTEEYYQSYTASLSSEVTALMTQAQQETIAEQQALAAQAAAAAAQTASGDSSSDSSSSSGGGSSDGSASHSDTGSSDNGTSGDGGSSSADSGSSYDGGSDDSYSDGGSSSSDSYYDGGSSGGSSYSGGGNHVSSVASIAYNYCGVPYVWGGSDPSGFDCSGLTQYCYADAGYSIGRTTYDQAANIESCGQMVYSMDQLEPGDLIFPHSGHVGIYEGGGCLIDAPYEGMVVQYRSCWFSSCFGGCPV